MITLEQLNKAIEGQINICSNIMPIRDVIEVGETYKVVGFKYKILPNKVVFPCLLIEGTNTEKYFEIPLSMIERSKGNFVVATIKNKDINLFNSEFKVLAIELAESKTHYPYKIYTLELVNYE